MKTKTCLLLCLFLGIGLTQLSSQATSTRDIDIPWSFDIPCVPEVAVGTITLHTVLQFDKNGNFTGYHYQPQGGVLIGNVTGTVYHGVGVTQEHFKSASQDGSFTDTFINKGRAIGTGKGKVSWQWEEMYHITVTKDGDVIVDRYVLDETCE